MNLRNIAEVLIYGTGEHCRGALDALADVAFDNQTRLDTLEDFEDIIEERATLTGKLEEAEAELARYKQFFEDAMSSWFETLASGHWPCAEPDDQTMLQALQADMQQGADALRALEELAAYAEDDKLTAKDALEAWSSVKNT